MVAMIRSPTVGMYFVSISESPKNHDKEIYATAIEFNPDSILPLVCTELTCYRGNDYVWRNVPQAWTEFER